jgi:hypothetical protein
MLHLDPERLAALADHEPTAEEIAHLAACRECARERAAYRELLALASQARADTLKEPLSNWDALAPRLREEGLVSTTGGAGGGRYMRVWRRPWLQAAAAVVLAVGGGVVGRLSASKTPTGGVGQVDLGRAGSTGASLTGTTANDADSARTFVSVEDALTVMARAESDYRLAAAYIAAQDSSVNARGGVDRYRMRLAALDKVSDAALAAVNEAPHDPVLNQYLISARSAREVTLQQLNSKLPAGVRLTSY